MEMRDFWGVHYLEQTRSDTNANTLLPVRDTLRSARNGRTLTPCVCARITRATL